MFDLLNAIHADEAPNRGSKVNRVARMHVGETRRLISQGRLAAAYQYAAEHRGENRDPLAGFPDDVQAVLMQLTPRSYQRPPYVLLVTYRRAMAYGDLVAAREAIDQLAERFYVLTEYSQIEAAEALRRGPAHDNSYADIDGPTDEELAVIAAELEVDFE
jgi:hypothetical protein